jgi:hypothetical protein
MVMKTKIAVITATAYLFVLSILGFSAISITASGFMYLLSPFVIIGFVYVVLTETGYKYPELGSKEEWGYRDKKKSELGFI